MLLCHNCLLLLLPLLLLTPPPPAVTSNLCFASVSLAAATVRCEPDYFCGRAANGAAVCVSLRDDRAVTVRLQLHAALRGLR